MARVEPKEQFARNLRELRHQRKLSLEALGEAAGLHYTQVGRYERGLREPKVTTIARLARGLEVPAGRLFDGID